VSRYAFMQAHEEWFDLQEMSEAWMYRVVAIIAGRKGRFQRAPSRTSELRSKSRRSTTGLVDVMAIDRCTPTCAKLGRNAVGTGPCG
jgi:hypothetical protein